MITTHFLETIEADAIHHFRPVGAMVCEEQPGDARAVLPAIAGEVGANEIDTRACFKSVTRG